MKIKSTQWKKYFLLGILSLLILAVAGGAAVYLFFRPRHQPVIKLQGLSAEVKIRRDRWGIPHIKAGNRKDLFRALGYQMAQDRLFQMDLNRRVGNGELSEIFGEKLLPMDKLFRTLRFRQAMGELLERHKGKLPPELLQLSGAFLEGVNAYVDSHTGLGELPLEFSLLHYRPRPFDLLDILAFSGYMAFSFNDAITKDPLWSKIKGRLPMNGDNNLVLPAFDGSNSWVLAPKKTQSGGAILANDPHIGFSLPGVWYEAHLECPDLSIYGHFLPLVPFPVLGHNAKFGWAITMSEVDDTDFYREGLDAGKNWVMSKGQWVRTKSYVEKIVVKGQKTPTDLRVVLTPHGPLMDNVSEQWTGKNLSLKWAFYHPQNFLLETVYRVLVSQNLKEFSQALSFMKAPGLNFSYADREGHIGWWVAGAIPRRPPHLTGATVMDGTSGKDDYLGGGDGEGYESFSSNPHLIDPADGVIVSANYIPPTLLDGQGNKIPGYYRPSERYRFLRKTLLGKEKWSPEELMRLQTTEKATSAPEVLAILFAINEKERGPLNQLEQKALTLLRSWQGESGEDSVPSALYHQWNQENFKLLFQDQWEAEDFPQFALQSDWWPLYRVKLASAPSSVVREGLTRSVAFLKEKLGGDIGKWEWGKLHTLEYVHPLGRVFPLNHLFNVGPFAVGGGENQVNNMKPKSAMEDFRVVAGPSTRRLVDFSHPQKAWGILPVGESGNLFGPHYQDQAPLFVSGHYRDELLDWSEIEKGKEDESLLLPQ